MELAISLHQVKLLHIEQRIEFYLFTFQLSMAKFIHIKFCSPLYNNKDDDEYSFDWRTNCCCEYMTAMAKSAATMMR